MSYVFTSSNTASAKNNGCARRHTSFFSFEVVDFDGGVYSYDTEATNSAEALKACESYCYSNGIQADYIALNNVESIY